MLGYCESVAVNRAKRSVAHSGDQLIAGEVAARNAALELIRHYITGEVELEPGASVPTPSLIDETPPTATSRSPEGVPPSGE